MASCFLRSGSRHLRTLAGGAVAVRTAELLVGVAILCVVVVAPAPAVLAIDDGNLTAGFVQVELPEGNFIVQSPYDVPENQRYSYDVTTGVRTFWVYADDKPFNTVTATNPRTEVRLAGHDYSSGVWQFEAYGYVPSGTSGASVMQIHNEDAGVQATTLMLHVYNGTLRHYSGEALEDDVYDRWFRLNVVHDVGASTVAVYVDGGAPRLVVAVAPTASHYFKFGVYVQHHDVSPRVESRWRNVTVYTKPN
ncbi:hypothetical protein HU200_019719 [Digitaria exilis]|uniref:Alginate lyase 2 domain-containing protein n=1 Tax=Digitaria exilis TaxID=1010633 RepID=A0A835KF14_9POAL|nr:hypothetical protein HU200_019719 [Digitaria exilis]CAB3463168.1 unnamed protein product [Digitaria exilis]